MSFFSHFPHGQDGFAGAGNSFSTPFSAADYGWEELDSYYSTCHHPEECGQCADYEEHLEVSATSFSAHHPTQGPPLPAASSFSHGVMMGRRLQREDDEDIISRYRSRLRHAQHRHQEALRLQTNRHAEIELLRRELTSVKDRLLAVQTAYEDLAMARLDDHGYFPDIADSDADSSTSRSEPVLVSASVLEDTGVPNVLRQSKPTGGFDSDRYFLDDEDEFEALQQLRHMEDREEWEHGFWSDFRPRTVSDDSSDEHDTTSSSSDSDIDSSPSSVSLPSTSSSSLVDVVDPNILLAPSASAPPVTIPPQDANKSFADVPNATATTSPDHDIAQLSALMAQAHQYNVKGAEALKHIKALIKVAERVPKEQRTSAQLYLLTHWKRKRKNTATSDSSSASSSSSSASLTRPPSCPTFPSPTDKVKKPAPPATTPPSQMFVDASGQGIGLIYNGNWLAWTFTLSHAAIPRDSKGRIAMSWAELIAVELGLLTFLAIPDTDAASLRRTLFIRSDNDGVVNALMTRSWTSSYGLSSILNRILKRAEVNKVDIVAEWISTKANPADGPSRGIFPPGDTMLCWAPGADELRNVGLDGVVNLVGRD